MNKIDEMKELERAATAGPWHCGELRGAWGFFSAEHMLVGEVCIQEDMELIVVVRNALPAVLDKIDRLTADLAIAQREAAQAQALAKQNHDSFIALEKAFINQGVDLRAERDQWKVRAAQAQKERDAAVGERDQHQQAVEDGRWVELPCRTGDHLWYVVQHDIYECRVMAVDIGYGGMTTVYTVDLNRDDTGWFFETSFGRTIFTTRAEAEAAILKEGLE